MSRVIDAILRLKDEFTKPLGNSLEMMTEVSRQGDRARKNMKKFGQGIFDVGKTLTASITLPLAGLAAVSYKNFESVDKQMALVKATMGDAKFATADLSKALSDAMANSIFSMDEGAAAMVNFARQGFDAAQAADMLVPALNLAAGTSTDLDAVTAGLGNTLKAFGASSEEATHYVDMFTQAQAQANTDVNGLFEAMSIAGPIAKTVGWDFEDIATLVGVFGDNSISASEGANALKTGLARLSAPAKDGREAMERLKIDIFDANGAMLPMVDVIDQLQKSFGGLTDEEKMAAASALFGKNQMSKWLALINGPGLATLSEMRDSISSASGTAQESADALMTPLEKLSSTFDVFKYTVGETLADTFVPLIEKATELLDGFRKLEPAQQQQILKFAAIAAAVGPLLMLFGSMIIGTVNLFEAIGKAKAAFTALSQAGGLVKVALAALSGPMGIVVAAIAGIIAIIAIVVTHFDTFKEAGGRAAGYISAAIGHLQEAFGGFAAFVSPLTTFIGNLFAVVLVAAFEGAAATIAMVIDGVANVIEGVTEVISGAVSFVGAILSGDWASAWQAAQSVVEGVFSVLTGIVEGFLSLIGGIGGAIAGAVNAVKNLGSAGAAAAGGNAAGTSFWRGGATWVGEKGPELIHLPRGTQIYPHEASLNRAADAGVGPVGASMAGYNFRRQEPLRPDWGSVGSVRSSSPAAAAAPLIEKEQGAITTSIMIPKIADQITVREEADIDKIGVAIARSLERSMRNRGNWSFAEAM